MELVVFDEHMPAAFLSFNERDHDIALFKTPDDRVLGHRDVEHLAFEIDGDLQDFKRFHQRLVGNSTKVLTIARTWIDQRQMAGPDHLAAGAGEGHCRGVATGHAAYPRCDLLGNAIGDGRVPVERVLHLASPFSGQ